MRRIGDLAVRTVDYSFVFILTVIIFSAIVGFSEWISNGIIKYVLITLSLIVVACFVIFGERILKKLFAVGNIINGVSTFKLGIILFLFVFFSKVFFVFLFNNDADKTIDMRLYKSFATQLANNGVITDNVEPALLYKYQVIYGLFLSPVIRIFGNDSRVLTSFLSLLFAVLSVLLYDIMRKHVGKNKAFWGLLLFNVLPVGLFETQLLIHETPLLFFYITSFWILIKCLDNSFNIIVRALALLISAVLIAFGSKINYGGSVVIISYVFFVLIMAVKEKVTIRALLKCGYIIACYAVCFVVISSICDSFVNNHVIVPKNKESAIEKSIYYDVELGWPIFLGTNLERTGHWNAEDAEIYNKYKEFETKEEAQNYIKGLINDRLQLFKDNPLLIPGHLFNKIKGLWGSPQLPFAYEEGNSINEFVLYGVHGIIYKGIMILSYWVFILLCAFILFSHTRHKNIDLDSFYTPVIQFKMMIIGITLALFLFEVMPKYVSHMQIIMFCIGIFSFSNFMDNSFRIHNKITSKFRLKNLYKAG